MITKTINVRIPEEQYVEMEEIVKARHYTSKAEFIRELLRSALNEYIEHIHKEVEREKSRYIPLREYRKKRGLK